MEGGGCGARQVYWGAEGVLWVEGVGGGLSPT